MLYLKVIEVLLHTPSSLNNYHKELEEFISETLIKSTKTKIDVKIVNELSKNTEIVVSLVSDTLSEFDEQFHQKYRDREFRFLFYYFQDVEIENFSDEVFKRVEFKSEVEKETKLYNSFEGIDDIKRSLEINLKESISDLIHKTNYSKINAHVINRSKGDKFYNNDNNLRKVDNFLRREKRISLINGLGGVGKTTLAIEYATQALHDNIYDYAIWFDVENGIESEIKKFAIGYLLDDNEDGKQEASYYERKFTDFLNEQPNSLVILDNLEYKGSYKKELEDFLNDFQKVDIIITSRQEITQLNIHPIQLDVLKNENDGLEMFKLISSRSYSLSEEQTLKEIVNYLGKLPLALEITANFLSEFENMEVNEYLNELKKKGLKLFARIEDYNHLKSLQATLTINSSITENESSLKFLKIFSLISPEPIEKEIIDKYLMEVLDISSLEKTLILKDLERFSYIEISSDGYSMHRLLQEAIIGEFFEGNEKEQVELITTVSLGIFWWFHDGIENYKYGSYFEKTIEQMKYILDKWQKLNIDEVKIYFYPYLAIYNQKIGRSIKESLLKISEGIALLKQIEIKNKEKMVLYTLYGHLLNENNQYIEALKNLEKALSLAVSNKNKSDIYHNIARVYNRQNEYEKAKKTYMKSLDLIIKEFGNNHIDLASRFNNLALIYDKEEKYKEAEEFYHKSLNIKKKTLSSNHPDIAITYDNLGWLYKKNNKYKESFDSYYLALYSRLNSEMTGDNKFSIKGYFNNLITIRNKLPRNQKTSINKKIEELNNLSKQRGLKHKIKKLK